MVDGSAGKFGSMIEIPSHREALERKLPEMLFEERQPSSERLRKPVINIVAVAAAVVLALVSILVPLHFVPGHNNGSVEKKEPGGERVAENRYGWVVPDPMQNGPSLDSNAYCGVIKPTPTVPSISLKEAEEKAGIKARLPRAEEITGKREAVYFEMSASENPQIVVHYSNGIMVTNEVWKEKPDYIAQLEADTKKLAEASSQLGEFVEVAGCQGILFHGVNESAGLDSAVSVIQLPPQLEWWDNGVKYHISSWNFNFTEEQLLEIAESMY